MYQLVSIMLVVMMWLQAPTADKPADAKATLTPLSVMETRCKLLAGEERPFGSRAGTDILIRVAGPAVEGATSYGQLKITEAVDDAGTDMKPKKEGMFMGDDEIKPLGSGTLAMLQKKGEKGFRVQLQLGPAARKATKIRAVKGEFQVLAGGKEVVVTAKNLAALYGKSISDPKLKEAGVQIKVVDPKQGGGMFGGSGDAALSLQLTGAISAVQQIEVLDKDGKDASNGSMSSGSDKQQDRTIQLKNALDDTTTLKVKLMVGQKTVKVPFELKDIQLP